MVFSSGGIVTELLAKALARTENSHEKGSFFYTSSRPTNVYDSWSLA